MISVVIRPFKSGGVFYPAGTVVDPAGITLYKSKIGENKIKVVDEHNLDEVARFLQIRCGIEDAQEMLNERFALAKQEIAERAEYLAKVEKAAAQYNIDMTGKTTEEVVAEVKAAAAAKNTGE